MLKAFVKYLKGSTSPELRIYSPNLHKILSKNTINEVNIKNFIKEIENNNNFDIALKKLLLNENLPKNEIKLFQTELENSKGIASAMVVHDFLKKSHILENLNLHVLPKNADELNSLIITNEALQNKVKTFIKLVNRHKLKLSVITLTLATVGNYLFQAAHNLSGCYRYKLTPSGEYKLLCKIKNCDENNEYQSSINGIFCNEDCLKGLCTEKNCKQRTDDAFKYICVELHWYDVLSVVTKQLSSSLSNFLVNILKYVVIFLVVFCTFSILNNFHLYYRIIVSFLVFLTLVIKLF